MTVGIIGVGRVGRLVIHQLQAFQPKRILANDIHITEQATGSTSFAWADKETIFREADIISLHVPLTRQTRHLIAGSELTTMKPDAILINTSRGEIVDERVDCSAARRPGFSAAIDVFEQEPYSGELARLENCLLSCHMGSCTDDCRLQMEMEAATEVIRYFRGESFNNPSAGRGVRCTGGKVMFTPVDDYLHLLADEDARDVPFVVRDFNFSVGLNIPEYCGGMSKRKFLAATSPVLRSGY